MNYRVIGINQDRDTCDHCGRKNLKKVVWLENQDGEVICTGKDCAFKLAQNRIDRQMKKAESRFRTLTKIKKMEPSRVKQYADAYGVSEKRFEEMYLTGLSTGGF